MEEKVFVVTIDNQKLRLDVYLEKMLPVFSRSHIKNQIEKNEVFVNNKNVKAGYNLKVNDEVKILINPPKTLDLTPEDIKIDIVYEDDDLAVINKPQGMVVHPAVGNYNKTLVNALLYNIKNLSGINGVIRPGIVHRLDKDTSGLLVVAKNDAAHVNLSKQIQNKTCKRFYLALLEGVLKDDSGVITNYISRDLKNRLKMAVNKDNKGKIAQTLWNVVERFANYTLCEFELKTGRTHQIRVHANYISHPVVGDELYNAKKNKFNLNGQLLHAYKLVFVHPTTNKLMEFSVPLPKYFEDVLNYLKKENHVNLQ